MFKKLLPLMLAIMLIALAVPAFAEEYVGIGMQLQIVDSVDETGKIVEEGLFQVLDLMPGGSAEKAGLRVGDIIISIDGKNAQGMTGAESTAAIREAEGSSVTIKFE